MIWIGGVPLDILIGVAAALAAWELAALLAPAARPRAALAADRPGGVAGRAGRSFPGAGGNLEVILPDRPRRRDGGRGAPPLPLGGVGRRPRRGALPRHRAGQPARPLPLVGAPPPGWDCASSPSWSRRWWPPTPSPTSPATPWAATPSSRPSRPSKSVEGAVGGVVGAVLVAGIAGPLVISLNPVAAVGMGLLIAVVAEGGDLAEFALKRQAGVEEIGAAHPRPRRSARPPRRPAARRARGVLPAGAHRLPLSRARAGRAAGDPTRRGSGTP